MTQSLKLRQSAATFALVLAMLAGTGANAWASSIPVRPVSSSIAECLAGALHRLLGRADSVPAPVVKPAVIAEIGPPVVRGTKAPGAPDGDLLPDPAPLKAADGHVLSKSRNLLESELALREARIREASGSADSDVFMRVEGVPGARLGMTPEELNQVVQVRAAASERIGSAGRRAPSGLPPPRLNASVGEIRFDAMLRRLPGDQAEALRIVRDAIRGPGPELGSYLQDVWDEAFLRAIRSGDAQVRTEALAGRIPERSFEEALRFRIEGQGFPPAIRIEDPLPNAEFTKLLRSGAAFIDDVDEGIVKARAAGQSIPALPLHGRLTHLVHLDFAATMLRRNGLPPENLRAALQGAATSPRSGEIDVMGARSVWGYLFDQASGSGAGLSVPDQMHVLLQEAWGLTR